MQHPKPLVRHWLALLGIPISRQYLEDQLRAHPDYPSLLSITDTLNQLGIENNAVRVNKKDFKELPVPFLAYLQGDSHEFILVTDHDAAIQQYPHLLARWSGIALIAFKPGNWHHAENNRLLQKERWQQIGRILFFVITAVFIGLACVLSANWSFSFLLLTATAGVFITYLIVSKELGIENRIADLICSTSSACDGGKHTTGSENNSSTWRRWSNAGIIYFTTQWLVLLIAQLMSDARWLIPYMSLAAAASMAFTVFSLYYQWRIKKAFCRLCLIVIGLLWIQFALLLPSFPQQGMVVSQHLWLPALMFIIIAAAWLSLRPLLEKYMELQNDHYTHLRFRNDVNVFATLLKQQQRVSSDNTQAEILLGAITAPLQILMVSSPFCKVCAHTHGVLHQLAEQYGNKICLSERFALDLEGKDQINAAAVQYIYQHLLNRSWSHGNDPSYNCQVLHDWFTWMDLTVFKEHYANPVDSDITILMDASRTWCRENNLTTVPKIFINGYELPKPYTVADLPYFIDQPEKLPSNNRTPTIATYSMNGLTATPASNS